MSFNAFSDAYRFDEAILSEDFPDYLAEPIMSWLYSSLYKHNLIEDRAGDIFHTESFLKVSFKQKLQLDLHRTFISKTEPFIAEVASDMDLFRNILAYMLQKYCYQSEAIKLDMILRNGSSAYTVMWTKDNITTYNQGISDLGWYVPEIVRDQAKELLSSNELIRKAWYDCYKRTPDSSSCVSKSIDFLEGFLRDKYWSKEQRTPSLWDMAKRFDKDSEILKFKGDSFLDDKKKIVSLLLGTSKIRGEHTTGEGREATQDEAIFVLHTTIYIWNLMR